MPKRPIHVFPLAGPYCAGFCGHSDLGDGWTALPERVTCPACGRAVTALAAGGEAAAAPERRARTGNGRK